MPRKPKGRGRGLGRGRGRGQQQQEKRPGGLHSAEGSSQSSSSTEPHHSLPQKLGDQSSLQKDQKEEKDVAQSAAVVSRSFLESGETGLKETRSSDESLRSESESTQAKRAAARRQEREKTSELTKPAKDVSATSSLATSPGLGVDSSHTEVSPSQAGARPKQREKDKTGKIHLSSQVQNQKQSPVPQSSAAREPARPQEPEVEARGGTKATRSVDRLAKQDSEVTITHTTALAEHQRSLRPPRRPDFGKAGKPIKLHANFFKLQVPNNHFMYHYDVEIEPSRCPRHVNHQVIDAVIQKYSKNTFLGRRPAFDGKKNIYSREKLPVGKDGVVLDVALPGEDGGKDRKYKVTIKFAANVNLSELMDFLQGRGNKLPQDSIQSMDVVLRQQPNLCYTAVGRSFFPPPGSRSNPVPLGGGCEVWFGFYQSVRPSQWKTNLLVNIDVSAKGFYKEQEVIELLCETLQMKKDEISNRRFQMSRSMTDEFCQVLKGLRIITTHSKEFKRRYTVSGLSSCSARELRFSITDEKTGGSSETTVEKYFCNRYQVQLRFPHLPCLKVGSSTFVPMEVCRLIPCPKRKLTDDQISKMIRETARPAWERQRDIKRWADECQKGNEKYLQDEFGMTMSNEMVAVEGRVLDPPKIKLGGNPPQQSLTPRDGQWDMRGKNFHSGIKISKWILLCYLPKHRCGADNLQKFSSTLMEFSRKAGMPFENKPCDVKYVQAHQQTNGVFDRAKREYPDLELIVAVIPDKGNKEIYEQVKQVGDVIRGVATQCIQLKQVLAAKPQVCSNIAMKINAKLGGINHIVDPAVRAPVLKEPVIIFGADVTHPSPGDTKTPSIAAVVASLDPNASRYCATVRVQDHREEIINDLANMIRELLIQFYKKTKAKPRKIIFYRDGVSEGQFDQVLKYEVRAVQEACMKLEQDYQPGITFVVVQKRHHARLFPADKRDACGKAGNIPPGTTVDRGITHPFEFDFYLCSHLGIQGTSRPTHYHVIYDDNKFTADSLQELTYQLCYSFARCPKAVSMPAPAYYAHLAAFRARNHLADRPKSSQGTVTDNLESFARAVAVNKLMEGEMYFT